MRSSSEPEAPLAALLGRGASFEGDLTLDGRVRLDGTWVGTLKCSERVEVGASGRVVGRIEAREIVLAGRLEGRAQAQQRLVVEAGAVVEGELEALELEVRPGATVRGAVRCGG